MRTYLSCILLVLTLSRSAYSSGYQTSPYDSAIRNDTSIQKLKSQIREILNDTALAPCLIGMKIIELENGNVLFAENNNKLFHPASNMKLLTTSTACNLLDKHFLLRTKITTNGKVSKGVLRGNLYIKGVGDPLLDTDDLDTIASVIRNQGIRRIEGNIIGDVSYFDTVYWGKGWMWDDEPDSYAAFISSLTINSNSVDISVTPGSKLKSRVNVTLKPVTKYIKFINHGITSNDTTIPTLTVTRRRGENTFLIEGR
ncbi:MAG TPA: D-alanyl-D-alanine carboxypeptidase/D-alanyl-D-alanine-endopeptidase, partial [Bacteroidota bacterium]|nr:D-alanyl-D-alanine carboxypeptidase/D-alanyl-D-alanine-endopeptidase [Bacteroidota bacterium]